MNATAEKFRVEPPDINSATLPTSAVRSIVAGSVAVGVAAAFLIGGPNFFAGAVIGLIVYLITITGAAFSTEGSRKATDRVIGALIGAAFVLVIAPLGSLIYTVVSNGAARFDGELFTSDMFNVLGAGGGVKHAIYGTAIMTGIAALIAIPLGVLVAIYLVEYGRGKLASSITTMVDVMTGIPSIVAGLFAYAMFVALGEALGGSSDLTLLQGEGTRSGLGGGVALAVLMTPVVIRTTEEMLRLVPNELREAAYGLGVPKWKMVVKIVLPTAISGILTGITLAIARVVGETAPLLIVAGTTATTNTNPFDGRMESLPIMAYYSYVIPGIPPQDGLDRSWAASLVLVMFVGILFLLARIISKVLQPKGLR